MILAGGSAEPPAFFCCCTSRLHGSVCTATLRAAATAGCPLSPLGLRNADRQERPLCPRASRTSGASRQQPKRERLSLSLPRAAMQHDLRGSSTLVLCPPPKPLPFTVFFLTALSGCPSSRACQIITTDQIWPRQPHSNLTQQQHLPRQPHSGSYCP